MERGRQVSNSRKMADGSLTTLALVALLLMPLPDLRQSCRRRRNLPQTAHALLLHVASRQIYLDPKFGAQTALETFRRYSPCRVRPQAPQT